MSWRNHVFAALFCVIILLLILLISFGITPDENGRTETEVARTRAKNPTSTTLSTPLKSPGRVLFCFMGLFTKGNDGFPSDGICSHVVLTLTQYVEATGAMKFRSKIQYKTLVGLLKKEYKKTQGGASLFFSDISESSTIFKAQTLQPFYEEGIAHYGIIGYKGILPDDHIWRTIVPTLKAIRKFHTNVDASRVGVTVSNPLYIFFGLHFWPYNPDKIQEPGAAAQRLEENLGFGILFVLYTHSRLHASESPCLNTGTPMRSPAVCKRISLIDYLNLLKNLTFKHGSRTTPSFDLAWAVYSPLILPTETMNITFVDNPANSTPEDVSKEVFCSKASVYGNFTDPETGIEVYRGPKETFLLESASTLKTKLKKHKMLSQYPDLGSSLFNVASDSSDCQNVHFPRLRVIGELLNKK